MKITKQLPIAVLGLISVIGINGAALLAGGHVAEATDEFPPNPSVEMSLSCKPAVIGDLHVTYKNDGGLSDAEFTTVIDGVTQAHVSLDAAIWGEVHYPLPEGSPGVVSISAPGMATVNTTVGPVDCFDATMHTEVVCVNGTPTISVTATNTGKLEDDYILALLNSPWFNEQAAIGVGGSKTFTQTLSDGAEEIAYLYSNHTGLIGIQSGSATCTAPTTTTTVVDTTVPETTTPATVPATTIESTPTTTAVVVDPPTTSTVAVGVPEPVRLPETGTSTTMMLLTAAGLVVTGWLLRRSTSA